MFKVDVYIEDQKLDLFDDEGIVIVDSIQNLRDPAKFFAAYTRQFSVPASEGNNTVFRHYYNADISNGFDARIRVDASIRVNGMLFRQGQVKLNEVKIKNGYAHSYAITFYGITSKIKEELRDARLESLGSLSSLNHSYDGDTVQDGFEVGLDASASFAKAASPALADVVYPFISHTTQYVLNSSKATYKVHPIDVTDDSEGLKYTDLKPAIRVVDIIDAIQTSYNVAFDSSGFLSDAQFGELWLWCHREKGGLVGGLGTSYRSVFYFDERTFGTGTDITYGNGYFTVRGLSGGAHLDLDFIVTITGTGNYDVTIKNAFGGTLYEEKGVSGTQTFSAAVYPNTGFDYVAPYVIIDSASTITSIDLDITATTDLLTGTDPSGTYTFASISPITDVDIPSNMPDMTCLDFLTNLFKMFNLTIDRGADGVYYIETLDNYYTGGATRDITPYVDESETVVMPSRPFDIIKFEFEEAGSFLMEARNELVGGDPYGDEKYDLGNVFEDNDYSVSVGFEKILFERMTDLSDDSIDPNMWAWCADPDGNPYIGAPILFHYSVAIPSTITTVTWDHDGGTSTTQARCSNTVDDGIDWTLTFGDEIGEYTQQPILGSLFTEYWENYIAGVYDIKSRIVRVSAWLPVEFISSYALSDTIQYRGREYFINEIEIDVTTGKAEIELVTKWL